MAAYKMGSPSEANSETTTLDIAVILTRQIDSVTVQKQIFKYYYRITVFKPIKKQQKQTKVKLNV